MNLINNKCPNCFKRSGLEKVGPDFEHVVGDKEIETTSLVPTKTVVKGVERLSMVVTVRRKVVPVTRKGPGSRCRKCGWSKRDVLSIHYDATCGGCKIKLGTWSHHEDAAPRNHYCFACSQKRVEAGKHDPDDDSVTFPISCAVGCGKVVVYLSWPEGDVEKLPSGAEDCYYCMTEECIKVRLNQREIERIAMGGAVDSSSEIFPSKVQ